MAKHKTKKFSDHAIKKIKKAGLPEPDQGTTKAEFAKLQKQWYAKLAKDGFQDIEWVNHATGTGHDSDYLKGSLTGGVRYHPGRDLYYQLASNYLLHCGNLKNNPYHKFIWKMHANGATYDEIEAEVKKRFVGAISKYTIYYDIKKLAKLCYKWNVTADEGLLRKRAEDRTEIEQRGLEAFYEEEYNWLLSRREPSRGKRV